MFTNKNIIVGVTGGIAAYKACEIIREIKKNNGNVRVVLTEAGSKFITALTLAALSENAVLQDMFEKKDHSATVHIEAARWAHAIIICPATANTIGKVASGIADNLLTTLILAASVPVIFCPAMNKEMLKNEIFQGNSEKLKNVGYFFVESDEGELACGEVGWGRLANNEKIIAKLKKILLGSDKLTGKKVLVTAGRTEEAIDPVRFLTNRSTGRMGFAIAEAAALNGADVTLISGPTNYQPFDGVNYFGVKTAKQMAQKVAEEFPNQDVVIMAAAVADFTPKHYKDQKIKKGGDHLSVELLKTKDILKDIGRKKGNKILVGFALETENEETNALKKLKEKNLDFIVLNNPTNLGAGFGLETNIVTILNADGKKEKLPLMSKQEVAEKIVNEVLECLNKNFVSEIVNNE